MNPFAPIDRRRYLAAANAFNVATTALHQAFDAMVGGDGNFEGRGLAARLLLSAFRIAKSESPAKSPLPPPLYKWRVRFRVTNYHRLIVTTVVEAPTVTGAVSEVRAEYPNMVLDEVGSPGDIDP